MGEVVRQYSFVYNTATNQGDLQVRLKQMGDLGQPGQAGAPALSHVEEVPLFLLPVFSPHFKNVFCISWCHLFLKVHQFSFFVDSEAVVFSYLFLASLLSFSCFLQTLLYFFLSMIVFSLS